MTTFVVDVLEPIEIDEYQSESGSTLRRAGDFEFQLSGEPAPVQ